MATEINSSVVLREQIMVPIQVNAECADCAAPFVFTGVSRLVLPPTHEHQCSKCRQIVWLNSVYPLIEFREDGRA